jgi:hypothetical protein
MNPKPASMFAYSVGLASRSEATQRRALDSNARTRIRTLAKT